jgi:hypothetical protein
MIRPILISTAVCLTAIAAFAADSKVDGAVATFKTVEGDAGKLKIFCEMSAVMDKAGDNPDAAADAKIDGYLKQLGPTSGRRGTRRGRRRELGRRQEARRRARRARQQVRLNPLRAC